MLSHPSVVARRLPVLLACNKADQGHKAHTLDFIRKRLEKEIDQVGGVWGWWECDLPCNAAAAAPLVRPGGGRHQGFRGGSCGGAGRYRGEPGRAGQWQPTLHGSPPHCTAPLRPAPPGAQMRSTRGALSDGTSTKQIALGSASEPFTFESLAKRHGVHVTVCSASALDRGGVADVAAFIRRCVPA